MKLITAKDTKPELTVRKFLHGKGFRFRTHYAPLPGKPDLAFTRARIAVFVHGCFWHMHTCSAFKLPTQRRAFWKQKLQQTQIRDREKVKALEALGWTTIEVWECEIEGSRGLRRLEHLANELRTLGAKSKR